MESVRAALYLRISKEEREDSIENQRMLLRSFCHRKGYSVVREYADIDISGLTEERPAFQRMLADAQKHVFDLVVVKNQARFSRSFQHIEKYLHRQFVRLGIELVGVADGVDTSKKENKKARQLYGLINEWYCQDLSENVRLVLAQKMQKGQFIGSFAPYGYQKSAERPIHLLVKYPEAQAVREIYEAYAGGESVGQITARLRKSGYPAPGGKEPELWTPRAIYRILDNSVYLGILQQGKTRTVSCSSRKRLQIPRREWICVEQTHPALICEVLFQQVQERKQRRGRKSDRAKSNFF